LKLQLAKRRRSSEASGLIPAVEKKGGGGTQDKFASPKAYLMGWVEPSGCGRNEGYLLRGLEKKTKTAGDGPCQFITLIDIGGFSKPISAFTLKNMAIHNPRRRKGIAGASTIQVHF